MANNHFFLINIWERDQLGKVREGKHENLIPERLGLGLSVNKKLFCLWLGYNIKAEGEYHPKEVCVMRKPKCYEDLVVCLMKMKVIFV